MAKKYAFTRGRYTLDEATGDFVRERKRVTPKSKVFRIANPPKPKQKPIQKIKPVTQGYTFTTSTGKVRKVVTNKPSAKAYTQMKLGKFLKEGKFDQLPKAGRDGKNLKKSVIAMAETVNLPENSMRKLRRMNVDRLHALMTVSHDLMEITFDYGDTSMIAGVDYSEEASWSNIEFLIARYEKTFGVIR